MILSRMSFPASYSVVYCFLIMQSPADSAVCCTLAALQTSPAFDGGLQDLTEHNMIRQVLVRQIQQRTLQPTHTRSL